MPTVAASSSLRRLLEAIFRFVFRSRMKRLAGIPGPKPVFPLGNALDFLKAGPHEQLHRYGAEYGDLVVFWLGWWPNVLINAPELVEHVLLRHRDDYYKNAPKASAEPVIRGSVFLSNGDDWAFKRQNHPFLAVGIDRYFEDVLLPTARQETRRYMQALQEGSPSGRSVDMFAELVKLSFGIFGRVVLGTRPDPGMFADFDRLMQELQNRGGQLIPISLSPSFWRSRRRWFDAIEARIAGRELPGAEPPGDILGFLASAGGTRLSKSQLRDELSTMFTAGTRNVAITVAATLFLCARNPDVQRRLRAEIADVTRARGDGLSLAGMHGMPYLSMVVQESLRLYPAVPLFIRQNVPGKTVVLAGHTLPKATQVFVSSWAMHRNERYWPNPEVFDPERFAGEVPPYRYIPFGAGPRTCAGRDFTLACAKIMLIEILSKDIVDVDASATFETRYFAGTIMPRSGLPSRIRPLPAIV